MDPILGQVILFAGNYAMQNYLPCDGRLLLISSNTALFSILGTMYGGDGVKTFGLPNLSSKNPFGAITGAYYIAIMGAYPMRG